MPRIAGITTKKNDRGEITHVTINVQKHKETITPVLQRLGVIEKTKFQKDCEGAITIEDARQDTLDFVRSLTWKK
ncbi:MAG: hypothetical protein ABIN25_14065 [Ginsengibacter sp.]